MAQWWGVVDRDVWKKETLAKRDAVADAAHRGHWPSVLAAVADDRELANSRRVGGRSGWTPLHQAAFHGAPAEVVEQLVAAGAWRTLRSTADERAVDVAARRGHHQLVPLLEPAPVHAVRERDLRAMEHFLHALVQVRTASFGVKMAYVPPQLSVLTEMPAPGLSCTVPGMYGGFGIGLQVEPLELEVTSHCRIVGYSGQTHRITPSECALVEDGWG